MESVYFNGGMIGTTLDFITTDKYVISTTTGPATPVYVGGTTSSGAGSAAGGTFSITSLTGGIGTAPIEGDVIIIAYAIGSTSDVNVSVSIDQGTVTELVDLYTNDTVDANLGVYYSVAGATPPTTVTPGSTGSTAFAGALAVHVWRNIDTTTPIDVTTTTATAISSALANPPAITTSTENAVVLAIGASGNDNATTPFTQGGDLSNFISIGGSDTEDATVGMGSIATTSTATVDPAAFSIATSTAYSWAAATVALRPKTIDIPTYGNYKNSGIWNLQAVLEAISAGIVFNEISELGTPDESVTTIPASLATTTDGLSDYTYAADISSFSSNDSGVLFEVGGGTAGTSVQIDNSGNLIVQTSGGTNTSASMSAFDGETGTLYVSISYGNVLDAYWVKNDGVPSSGASVTQILQITGFSSDYAGSGDTGIGAVDTNQGVLYGTNYGTYSGTVTGWRNWANIYYDFSAV